MNDRGTTYGCGPELDRSEATGWHQVQQADWHLQLSRPCRREPVSRTVAHETVIAVGHIIAGRFQ